MPIRRLVLSTLLLLLAPAMGAAQPLPELPPPRPVGPAQPLPVLPPPRPVNPAPGAPPLRPLAMAKQAAESNGWTPVCEPEGPTPGLWGPGPPCA